MSPSEIYRQRTTEFGQQADRLQKLENRLSLARLISFVLGLALFFTLLSVTVPGAVIALMICLILFGWLVKYFATTEKEKNFFRHMEKINQLELACIDGFFLEYADGSEYISRDHPNSYDLDLFGHASLFQYMNRTTSKPASDMLAAWLQAPASIEEISMRQPAVIELKPLILWRQKMISLGYINSNSSTSPEELLAWVHGGNWFVNRQSLKWITWCLSALGLLTTVLIIILGLPAAILIPVLSVNFLFYFSQGKKISTLAQSGWQIIGNA